MGIECLKTVDKVFRLCYFLWGLFLCVVSAIYAVVVALIDENIAVQWPILF